MGELQVIGGSRCGWVVGVKEGGMEMATEAVR